MHRLPLVALVALAACATGRLPQAAIEHNRVGADRLAAGEIDDAEARFRLALEYHPRFAEPHANLGVVMLRRGDLDAAELHLRNAIRLNPDFDEAYSNLGVVLLRRGDFDGAAEAFERALAVDPGLVDARQNLADVWMMRGDLPQARAQLMRLVQVVDAADARRWARAHGMLAYAELRLDRPDAARERADHVLARDPDEPLAHVVRGILAAQSQEYDTALTHLARAEDDRVAGFDARVRIAAIQVAQGEVVAAAPRVRALLRHHPEDASVSLVAAWLHIAAGRPAEARAHAARALRLSPELDAARQALARACDASRGPECG